MKRRRIIIYIIIGLIIFAGLAAFILNKYFRILADSPSLDPNLLEQLTGDSSPWRAPSASQLSITINGQTLTFMREDGLSGKVVDWTKEEQNYTTMPLNTHPNLKVFRLKSPDKKFTTTQIFAITDSPSDIGGTNRKAYHGVGIYAWVNTKKQSSLTLDNGQNQYFHRLTKDWMTKNQNVAFKNVSMVNYNVVYAAAASFPLVHGGITIETPTGSTQPIKEVLKQCQDLKPQKISTQNQWPQNILDAYNAHKEKGIDLFKAAFPGVESPSPSNFAGRGDMDLFNSLVANADPENYYETARSIVVNIENDTEIKLSERNTTYEMCMKDAKTFTQKGRCKIAELPYDILSQFLAKEKYALAIIKGEAAGYYIYHYTNNYLGCVKQKLDPNDPQQKELLDKINKVQDWSNATFENIKEQSQRGANETTPNFWDYIQKEFNNTITDLMKKMMVWVWSFVSAAPL